ncbi:MAG: hypothetical protein GY866_25050 [Proteobacteria bacterium]|nr:hypothetical protein [Pseudomonadota bacterium]
MTQTQSSGNRDQSIDNALKAFVSQGDICIVYLVPDGYTLTQSANWSSPLEGATAGNSAGDAISTGLQHYTGVTTVSQLNSVLKWLGNAPLNISFQGQLSAKYKVSVYEEVLKGVSETFQIMSTELKNVAGFSGKPAPVTLTIFENIIFQECQIPENSTKIPMRVHELAKVPLKAEIDLTFSSQMMLNSSEFAKIFNK